MHLDDSRQLQHQYGLRTRSRDLSSLLCPRSTGRCFIWVFVDHNSSANERRSGNGADRACRAIPPWPKGRGFPHEWMKQALVIGQTRILAVLAPWLVRQEYEVSLISRSSVTMADIVHTDMSRYVTPLVLNYHDSMRLRRWIEHVQLMQGPLDLVVSWIEEPKESVLTVIFEEIAAYRNDFWRWIDVIDSLSPTITQVPKACQIQRILLPESFPSDKEMRVRADNIISTVKLLVHNPDQSVIALREF